MRRSLTGQLTLLRSKNDPVFVDLGTPLNVTFPRMPVVGESFIFETPCYGPCHTSDVQAIDSETGEYLLQTRNSLYKLKVETAKENNTEVTYYCDNDPLCQVPHVKTVEDSRSVSGYILLKEKTPVEEQTDVHSGKKHDGGKPPMALLSGAALVEVAKVLDFGSKKYDSWNWKGGFKWSRLASAVLRHIFAWLSGEDKDPETGLSHLAHAICGLMFLVDFEINKLGEDDRYKGK